MTRRRTQGFTLIEGVVAIVVLSVAVPVSLVMMSDASSARGASLQRERAVLLIRLLRNEVVADVASPGDGLGIAIFDDVDGYETSLRARIADRVTPYEDLGFSWALDTGSLVGPRAVLSGTPEENIYRPVTITVGWSDVRSGAEALDVTLYLTEVGA